MQAVQFTRYGTPEVLSINSIPIPQPQPQEVLVKVYATSVNPHDVAVRSGRLRLLAGRTFPKGTGIDFVGEISELGSAVWDMSIGDRVWGVLGGVGQNGSGAAAEYVTVDADRVAHAPTNLDSTQAASLLAGGTTAITALRDKASLQAGDRVLIRGGTGGVGSLAVQYARALGAHITTLSSAKTLTLAEDLGADIALDYAASNPSELPKYNVILDTVGSDLRRYRRLLSPGGRMVSIALGRLPSMLYIFASAAYGSRRIRIFSGSPTRELLNDLTTQAEKSALTPVIDQVYCLEDIVAAHQALEGGGGPGGKRVLRVG
ncbi:NAD(P)-dependent alcohol dehydrogenase [Rhodococcus baikonurensis]|uniref:NAD(P)-dependent alcohol dehydrogenase n=1 Tax=Rhodococcus erythropolis group TaxID=2840174 RepID=UPI000BB3BBFF|nr:NAD(P)-dependent alcohol dehydrogenase [Rhodococcus erythropolis]PBI88077.1 Zinc-type alcohol dehydrogenase-like protein [Rhodococcus erythropolis]